MTNDRGQSSNIDMMNKNGSGTVAYNQALVNRLARAIGHIKSIKKMVESDRDCSEVLIQLSAVKSAVNGAGKEVLKVHIEDCISNAIRNKDQDSLKRLNKAIDLFIK